MYRIDVVGANFDGGLVLSIMVDLSFTWIWAVHLILERTQQRITRF
jgi:hypothetical protein